MLLSVEGMWCASCALAIEHRLRRLPGVRRVGVDYLSATLLVEGVPDVVSLARVAPEVGRLGYRLRGLESAQEARCRLDAENRALAGRLLLATAFAMWTMLASLLIYAGAMPEPRLERVLAWVSGAFALPVVTLAAWPFYRAAWRTLRAGRPGMDALVSLGVWGALGMSLWLLGRGSVEVYFDTAVMLVLLLLAGRWVETLARYRGLRALEGLAPMPDRVCRLREDGSEESLPAAEVGPGERIRVAAEEALALDGELLDAEAKMDLALLTGESRPRILTRGELLFAGCHNLGPPLTLRVTAGVGARRLDQLYRRMRVLQVGKSELRRMAERFAGWLSPAALVLALLTLAALLLAGVAPEEAAVRALSVLVVACPCAVGLAVPLASLAGSQRALSEGVVFNDPAALELAAQVRTVAFDKTGTLTRGERRLMGLRPACGLDDRALLALAARAEWGSEHTLGRAIRVAAAAREIDPGEAPIDQEEHPGGGRRVREAPSEDGVPGSLLQIGKADWLVEQGVTLPDDARDGEGPCWATRVDLARDRCWLGCLWLEDSPHTTAGPLLEWLGRQGIALALISGDHPPLVRRLGGLVGLPEAVCYGGRSPEAKLRLVASLPRPSLYVGDGINDAPALAAASLGVATSEATRAARDAAAIQLLSGGVDGVARAVITARATRAVMRQNLVLSVLYNTLALGLAMWMVIPPQMAVLAMALSSFSVMANTARLGLGSPQGRGASRAPGAPPGEPVSASGGG